MRWLVALLILINCALYLWSTDHQGSGLSSVEAESVINPEAMELVRDLPVLKPNTMPFDDLSLAFPASSCYRVGPFYHEVEAETAADYLASKSLSFSSVFVPQRTVQAYRVYMGPYFNPADIVEMQQRLVGLNVEDHYIKREQDAELISLGIFTQLNRAEKVRQQLKDKQFSALLREENRTLPSTYWLELRQLAGDQVDHGAFAAKKWPGSDARYLEIRCKELRATASSR